MLNNKIKFNKLQDTATELGSKDIFLMPLSKSKLIRIFQLVNLVNHSCLSFPNVLQKCLILTCFSCPNSFFAANLIQNLLVKPYDLRVVLPIQKLLILESRIFFNLFHLPNDGYFSHSVSLICPRANALIFTIKFLKTNLKVPTEMYCCSCLISYLFLTGLINSI